MGRHQEGQKVQVEIERLNGDPCAEGLPTQGRSCLKWGVILASLMGLVALVLTCLFFLFVFRPCIQENGPAQDSGKVNITCRLQGTDHRGQYDIFKAEKAGKYLIYGWLRRPTDTSQDVRLVHTLDANDRTLQKNNDTGHFLFFFTEASLLNNSRISLWFTTKITEHSFHVYEL